MTGKCNRCGAILQKEGCPNIVCRDMEKHHPYCKELYFSSKKEHISWYCRCEFLKAYDMWRIKPND